MEENPGSGDVERSVEEEMAVLARVIMSTSVFLENVAGSYIFLAYAVAVPALILLAEGFADAYGARSFPVANVGSIAGALLATALIASIVRDIFYIAARSRGEEPRRPGLLVLAVAAAFALSSMAAAWAIVEVYPGFVDVAWYYGIDAALAALAPIVGGWAFIVASLVLTAFLPVVLLTLNQDIALGAMMLGYLAGGTWSLWRASRILARR